MSTDVASQKTNLLKKSRLSAAEVRLTGVNNRCQLTLSCASQSTQSADVTQYRLLQFTAEAVMVNGTGPKTEAEWCRVRGRCDEC